MVRKRAKRRDDRGRAFAGSQLQIQLYVNRRRALLDAAIRDAIPSLGCDTEIDWRSPIEAHGFAEHMDGGFLRALGLDRLRGALHDFWPRGGPRWDGLAIVRRNGSRHAHAYLLVEAKSYPNELIGRGCMAPPESSARGLIDASLAKAASWARPTTRSAWLGPLYQYANRLAHVYFVQRETGRPTWLANVCFLDDPHRPTTLSEWVNELKKIKKSLGFEERPVPQSVEVFLEAGTRGELLNGDPG